MVVALTATISVAAVQSFAVAAQAERRLTQSYEAGLVKDDAPRQITELIRHAYLSPDATTETTFFVSTDEEPGLAFTTTGLRVPTAFVESTDGFETNNETFGPQGGVTEVALSTTAVGDNGGRAGLFLRRQTPADADPTQGGRERVLDPVVTDATFEFWDGTSWVTTWDTRTQTTKRLPAAVRVTLTAGEDDPFIFTVAIPASDVDANNPIEAEAAA